MLFRRKPKDDAALEDGGAAQQPHASDGTHNGAAGLHDELGLHQLWYLELRLKDELTRAARAETIFSIACWRLRLLPGEQTGPNLLRQAADLIRGRLRSYDVYARLDEERFVAVLFDADTRDASTVAFRLKGDMQVKMQSAGRWQAGVATFPKDGLDGDALIQAAFRRMDEDSRAA